MASPPVGVKLVMEAVCLLLGVEPKRVKPDITRPLEVVLDYWEPAKKLLLGDPRLIQRLVEFDKDHVDPRAIRAVSEFIADPLLEPDTILRVRTSVYGCIVSCVWLINACACTGFESRVWHRQLGACDRGV